MKKRILCVLLLLSLVLGAAVSVSADEYDDLRQDMLDSFLTEGMLDISEHELTVEQVQEIYDKLYHSGQMPWYADEDCDYVFGEGDLVKKFRPKVLNPKIYDRDLYEQKMAELMAESCQSWMSDWQKALSVHDYIVLHTMYDEEYMHNTGYDSLIGGATVCYGYSMLYMDAMNRLGIPCQIVVADDTGDGEGHAWNVVQLDGQWYHVDLTWADPVPDVYGFSLHRDFLRTDQEFKEGEEPHDFPWEALVEVSEESFSQDDFAEDVYSAVIFLDANHVIYRREVGSFCAVVSRDLSTGKETILADYYRAYLDLGYGEIGYPTYGLSFWNGRIYFNQEDKVLSMLPDGSDLQEVYTYEVTDRYICGMMVDEGVLHLALGNHEMLIERTEVELENVEFHSHSYEEEIVFATCQAEGYRHMACQCGVSYNRTPIPQLEHMLTTTMDKAPTTQARGEIRRCCLFCQYQEREYPPALPAEETEPKLSLWIPIGGAGVLVAAAAVVFLIRRKKRPSVTES